MSYFSPRAITNDDDVDAFECRSSEQSAWLQQHAKQSAFANATKVFVVEEVVSKRIVAYYAWRMAQIEHADAPDRLLKGSGKYPQPVALLARLGVDIRHERRGLGAALLQNAITRMLLLGQDIGCRGLLIHAETEESRNFYRHLMPDLEASPTDPLHLVLLMKDARHTFGLA